MSDRVILDHKKSYLVDLENFHFCEFFTYDQFCQKSLKIPKNENFQNRTNFDFLRSKMTLSDIIFTKNSKSPGESGQVRGGLQFWNKVIKNTVYTSEYDLDYDIISHLTSKYRPDFFVTFETSGPDESGN